MGALWLFMGCYIAWVGQRAWADLTDEYVVQGLFRTYQPPRETPDGWLIDVRPGDLLSEIQARYAPGTAPTGLAAAAEATLSSGHTTDQQALAAWTERLTALGYHVRPGQGVGSPPGLLFVPGGPWLLTGHFQGQPTVFDPRRGVVLLADAVVADTTLALELLDVEAAP